MPLQLATVSDDKVRSLMISKSSEQLDWLLCFLMSLRQTARTQYSVLLTALSFGLVPHPFSTRLDVKRPDSY